MKKAILFCSIISFSLIVHTIPIVNLKDIDFSELRSVLKVSDASHTRTVYIDQDEQFYYKVWSANYFRAVHFESALNAGFYETLAPLTGIIYDEQNKCRGYILKKGVLVKHHPTKYNIKITPVGRYEHITPISQQTNKEYIEFYWKILKTSKETGFAYIDLSAVNIIYLEGKFQLIDLESIEPIKQMNTNFFSDNCFPPDYREAIRKLKRKK